MPTYPVKEIIDDQPTFEKPLSEILSECKRGGAIKVLTPLEYVTDRQRRWYKGVCLPHLVKHDENRESAAWWDREIKTLCDGLNLLKPEYLCMANGEIISRLTTKGVGKRNMSAFIEEILAKSVELSWGISPPDADLRKK